MRTDTDRNESSNESHGRASASRRDIGKPKRLEPYRDELRDDCESLRRFLEICFPKVFRLEWSQDHLDVIETLQQVIDGGGLFALAMPRGSGKTSLATRAALWAILTGRKKYVELIAGTEAAAKKIVKTLKAELFYNKELTLLFPLEMHGISQLNGNNKKAPGQLCHGKPTGVNMGTNDIVFPRHQYSPVSGAMFYATGLTGNVRGPNHQAGEESDETIRPDFVMLDDPQTRESAKSKQQTEDRIEIIEGDVFGLAGPGESMSLVMTCTVIIQDDLADHFLKHPQWHSKRAKLLPTFPDNMSLWDQYFEVRSEGKRVDKTEDAGNEFYLKHETELERGAVASWPARKKVEEFSAIQSAMHLWYQSPTAFAAEYNNDPLDASQSLDVPTFNRISGKLTNLERGIVPVWATKVTIGVDVQGRCLFWVMVAWADDFTGSIINYGAWPEQSRAYYDLAAVNPTLQQASGMSQLEPALRWGLDGLSRAVLSQSLIRENGGEISIGRFVVDANWGQSTDTVYEFCRRTPFSGIVIPAHGRGVKAGDNPMDCWPKKPGETHGWNWIQTPGSNQRAIRHVIFDTNFWKTLLAERSMAAVGERGSLSMFGTRTEQHKMIQDHLTAETPTRTSGRGREVWEWKARPGEDNHWLDCLNMAAVGASMMGAELNGVPSHKSKPLRTFSLPGVRA